MEPSRRSRQAQNDLEMSPRPIVSSFRNDTISFKPSLKLQTIEMSFRPIVSSLRNHRKGASNPARSTGAGGRLADAAIATGILRDRRKLTYPALRRRSPRSVTIAIVHGRS